MRTLTELQAGQLVIVGGDQVLEVDADLAAAFAPGDRLIGVPGALLHLPAAAAAVAEAAVGRAADAFDQMGAVDDEQITAFYRAFAAHLADDVRFAPIAAANAADLEAARARGRSTTRLELTDKMRADMIAGLEGWAATPPARGRVIETVEHPGWTAQVVSAGLGVVGFVFEGRPNVFADATGVLRAGNTVVFRIGSDALGTAEAIMSAAVEPALSEAGLPPGAVSLVASPAHAAGWALFADQRLALAVARGSGPAVAQLGAVARQAGVPVSLHGTGGAWMIVTERADLDRLGAVVAASLDRKVCNTLNTVCVEAAVAERAVPVILDALDAAAHRRGVSPRLHLTEAVRPLVPADWFDTVTIERAQGALDEPRTDLIATDELGREWEWETSPEISLTLVADLDEAIDLLNRYSPRFVASLISDDPAEHERFFELADAPFVGDGFTRWVDGQYAFDRPELGLSNWEHGRLLGRGGVLSGDAIVTHRVRVTQTDPTLTR